MISISKRSIGSKLSVSAIAATALVLVAAISFVSITLLENARTDGARRIRESVDSASALLSGYDDSFRKTALRDFGIYKSLFPNKFEWVNSCLNSSTVANC